MIERLDATTRTAVVTGAGSGIGRAIAIALADEGTTIVLAGRRADALRTTGDLVAERGGRPVVASIDLGSDDDLETLTATVGRGGGEGSAVLAKPAPPMA